MVFVYVFNKVFAHIPTAGLLESDEEIKIWNALKGRHDDDATHMLRIQHIYWPSNWITQQIKHARLQFNWKKHMLINASPASVDAAYVTCVNL